MKGPRMSFHYRNAAITIAAIGWSVCCGLTAHAADTVSTPAETAKIAAYDEGMAATKRKDWSAAVKHFEAAVASAPTNADAHNMLGYSYRWLGKYKEAFASYDRAFAIDPNHRGAHEYAGIAQLKQKNVVRAKWHLAQLERICGQQCEEYKDLARAITEHGKDRAKG
jgi:tetratricopeptide (TPR) repeat protein